MAYSVSWEKPKLASRGITGPGAQERKRDEKRKIREAKERKTNYYIDMVGDQIELLQNSGQDSAGEAQFRAEMIQWFTDQAYDNPDVPRNVAKQLQKASNQAAKFFKDNFGEPDENNAQYKELKGYFLANHWEEAGLVEKGPPVLPPQ